MERNGYALIYKIYRMVSSVVSISFFVAMPLFLSLSSCASLGADTPKECSTLWAQKKYADYVDDCGENFDQDVVVQYHIGYAYYWGLTGETNYTKAAYHYAIAAKLGDMHAQYDLGLMYLYGQGVNKDSEHAFWWIERAAEQGYVVAQKSLVEMYLHGVGVVKDPQKAKEWQERAFKIGNNSISVDESKPSDSNNELSAEELYFNIRQEAQPYSIFPNNL